jgi:hypothetical protein
LWSWDQIRPGRVVVVFWGSATPLCISSSSALHIFSEYSFWVHRLVNRDDRHLLTSAMFSDFSVTWQCHSKRTMGSGSFLKYIMISIIINNFYLPKLLSVLRLL